MRQHVVLLSCFTIALVSAHSHPSNLHFEAPDWNSLLGQRDLESFSQKLYPRTPIPGSSQTAVIRSGQLGVSPKQQKTAKAGFQQSQGGVSFLKNQEGKTSFHLGRHGGKEADEDPHRISAGGRGVSGGTVNTWAMGNKSKVSAHLEKGSALVVTTTQADGSSSKKTYNTPGRVPRQEFESGFPGHQMQIQAALHGKGRVRVRGSQR